MNFDLLHDFVVETLEPQVEILSLTILSPGQPELVLPIPFEPNAKGYAFCLKDGSLYHLKFSFKVSNNIVSGLKYTNTVWKTGVRGKQTAIRIAICFILNSLIFLVFDFVLEVICFVLRRLIKMLLCDWFIAVENTKVMLGTFSPQQEPYTYELAEERTPSGMFARGSYSAKTKVHKNLLSFYSCLQGTCVFKNLVVGCLSSSNQSNIECLVRLKEMFAM